MNDLLHVLYVMLISFVLYTSLQFYYLEDPYYLCEVKQSFGELHKVIVLFTYIELLVNSLPGLVLYVVFMFLKQIVTSNPCRAFIRFSSKHGVGGPQTLCYQCRC